MRGGRAVEGRRASARVPPPSSARRVNGAAAAGAPQTPWAARVRGYCPGCNTRAGRGEGKGVRGGAAVRPGGVEG
jgi:hypothetical protein